MGREFSRNDKFLATARSKNHTSSHETLTPNRGHSREGVPLLNVAIAFADRGDRTQKEPAGSLSAPGDGAMPLSVPCQAKRREREREIEGEKVRRVFPPPSIARDIIYARTQVTRC